MKFKVGDKAVVVKDNVHPDNTLVGRIVIITDVDSEEVYPYRVYHETLKIEDQFKEDELELAKPYSLTEQKHSTEDLIIEECESLKELLLSKNKAYGNSVQEPGVLFQIDPITAIKARINDKIKRIQNKGITDQTEDTIQDLLGYLVHLRIAIRKQNEKPSL